ncbi:MAG: nickel pincer cofactor biosynthesis protein LarB [Verrucomicrobia bacterium]|nr:nickel pincer cofactor biosynthesis protein LarB [Verrucomicrobiota bacterium]
MSPDFVRVDLDRAGRCGRAETIFCEGKLPSEVAAISAILREAGQTVLATRARKEHFDAVAETFPDSVWHERARCITIGSAPPSDSNLTVGVICAGTADLPVADEASVTLESFGHRVERITDVGVAGIHRLLDETARLRELSVLIVVAGMEGALPSVVAGLVDRPVIAVPTSVGYGASLGGLSALLGMLTSCSSKVTVVNIDNGFGAASAADAILRLAAGGR